MEASPLAPPEAVAVTADELNIASTGYTPRFQSKKLEIIEPAPTLNQPPENEWVSLSFLWDGIGDFFLPKIPKAKSWKI